jgi:hypothetical protein
MEDPRPSTTKDGSAGIEGASCVPQSERLGPEPEARFKPRVRGCRSLSGPRLLATGMRSRLHQMTYHPVLGLAPQVTRASIAVATLLLFVGAAAPRRSSTSDPVRAVDPARQTAASECSTCHDLHPSTSHPVGVRTKPVLGLPLERGRVTCGTCHVDRVLDGAHVGGAAGDGALRLPAGELCAACHGAVSPREPVLYHALLAGRAHGVESDPSPPVSGLDRGSRACLACHDGSAAAFARIEERGPGSVRPSMMVDLERDHPLGVSYEPRRGARAPQLRPASSLPPSVQLPGGRLGCASCHSVYSGQPWFLSVEPRGSRLCLTCHVK